MLTLDLLRKLWPHGNITIPGLVEGMAKTAPVVFPKYGIDSSLLIAHVMAQFSEETDCGREMQENMNYSAGRLLQVFPTHFSHSQAIQYQHNPRQIADHAYGGRMGNLPPPSDDGWNFRGQGLSQVTGKNGYQALAKKCGLDLGAHPELIIAPDTALECGVADFVLCGCLPYARKDDIAGVSSMLNVGHYTSNTAQINGFSVRRNWLGLWKHALDIK